MFLSIHYFSEDTAIPYAYPDEPPSNADGWRGPHPDSSTPSRLGMLYFAAFLVVSCLLHSFPVFCTCLCVTLSDIAVAEFGHASKEARFCSYFSIQ